MDIKVSKKGVSSAYTDKDGKAQKLEADRLVVSIGRIPNTQGLGADKVGLKLNERGMVKVDGHCKTNLPGVWAIGDVVRAVVDVQQSWLTRTPCPGSTWGP